MLWRNYLTAVVAVAPAADLLAADYTHEAMTLAKEIVEVHPRGEEIADTEVFRRARSALLAMAGDTDFPHYAVALGRLFQAADDGHTAAIAAYSDDPAFTLRYPLRIRRFEDGLYVVAAKEEGGPLLGTRLTRVGGEDVDVILRGFVAASAGGNRAWPANFMPLAVSVPGWLIGLDIVENEPSAAVCFEGETTAGERVSAMLTAREGGNEELRELDRTRTSLEEAAGDQVNFVHRVPDGRALVLGIGAMQDQEGKSFEAFTGEAALALADDEIQRVVIDLRDNGGGDNMLAEPLRRTLVKSRFNRPGGIYVLTSPGTFSAAMNFATRLERETDALFVGEPTGGSPNHFGDAKFKRGPESGVPYIISTLRWQDSTPFDERRWILPDLPAPATFADHVAGRDAALTAALADQTEPVESDWRERVAMPWDRPSQLREWKFFFEE